MEKQDLRSLSSEEKLALRRVAIRMLKKGKSKSDIIADLGINKNTMTAWAQAYNSKGSASFKYKKRGVKSADKKLLSVDQE
ncbi:MAG: helix-turn-helix domain-containing protein, partial [Flavobacteriales bacterium]